jgi:hypothetical protein
MSHEHEESTGDEGVDAKKLSAVGGFVGTVVGARRGAAGAVAGGVVGGTLGYLTGATLGGTEPIAGTDADPVAIDVSDPEENEPTTEDEH